MIFPVFTKNIIEWYVNIKIRMNKYYINKLLATIKLTTFLKTGVDKVDIVSTPYQRWVEDTRSSLEDTYKSQSRR